MSFKKSYIYPADGPELKVGELSRERLGFGEVQGKGNCQKKVTFLLKV